MRRVAGAGGGWWQVVGVSAWVDLPVCGFQPAGTEPSQASSWLLGSEGEESKGARQLGIQSELLHPCSGSRPWSWSRWAFDLLGKPPQKSLIV